LAAARDRAEAAGWENVTLLEAPAEDATASGPVDAVLFAFTPDVTRSPKALANVLGQVRPGGRLAAAGPKWTAFAPQLNPLVWQGARQHVAPFAGGARGPGGAQGEGVRPPAHPGGVAGGPPVCDHLRGVQAALGRAGAGRARPVGRGGLLRLCLPGRGPPARMAGSGPGPQYW